MTTVSFRAAQTGRNPLPKHMNRSVGGGFLAVFAARNDTEGRAP
jgi:hypothetical protein